ncbi:uncharacterized protein BYT42DRAFT_575925 [Radiomyces spectabilis]|uniref:uncharacterized protein n=1 Tax=Radiomyces spectabilis TaxID=64574 RepID=UPI002220E3F7|nr:uncharacterized protein BYT42DRAFT_575925 [Radiomyces spectabilis]KAI8374309.1 hypothetical protein BYT42DRAFT_575925 [Radiomyces spectabilis]
MVEFYHTEIPPEFRHQGVGDLLVKQGFQWAEESNLLVIPTCTFVKRHIEWSGQRRACIVRDEEEGTLRLQNNHSKSDQK